MQDTANNMIEPFRVADFLFNPRRLLFPVLLTKTEGSLAERLGATVYPLLQLAGRRAPSPVLALADERARFTVGRTSESDIVVPDPSVSRRHATIVRRGTGLLSVVDEGSRNGTYIDGERLRPGIPMEIRGGLASLNLGPDVRTSIMPENMFLDWIAAVRAEGPSTAAGDRPSGFIKCTLARQSAPDELAKTILGRARSVPFVPRRYEVTMEDAIIEELRTWPELVALVEGKALRILQIAVATADYGGRIPIYTKPEAAAVRAS